MSTSDWISALTCFATWIYVGLMGLYVWLVFETLRYIRKQLVQQEKEHKFQETITIFKELQTQELFDQRRYIYENFPENIEGIDGNQLKAHIQKPEVALVVFDRIGYLIRKGHIDAESIMENHWSSIWRCWRKSRNLIGWVREQRNETTYLEYFEHLFNVSEDYRIQNGYPEPKIYTTSKIIT